MTYNGESIDIYFRHYGSFDEAISKWNERKQRIDMNNLYIIMQTDKADDDVIRGFESFPYPNKLLIANRNPHNDKNIVVHKMFNKRNYQPGNIFKYKFLLYPVKRYLDDIDYVSFLNKNNKK